MPQSRVPDAREVDRVEAIVAAENAAQGLDWPARCTPGSTWIAQIRTAEVVATVLAKNPLGTFDERMCTCLSLQLELPVPVKPGLRFSLIADDASDLRLSGVVRPWGG